MRVNSDAILILSRQVLLMSATMDIQSLAQLFPNTPPVLKIPGMLGFPGGAGYVGPGVPSVSLGGFSSERAIEFLLP